MCNEKEFQVEIVCLYTGQNMYYYEFDMILRDTLLKKISLVYLATMCQKFGF
jgi:hypothetical protein